MKPIFVYTSVVLACSLEFWAVATTGSADETTVPKVRTLTVVDQTLGKPVAPDGYRFPGEFEWQPSLLVSTSFLTTDSPHVFSEIVRTTRHSTKLVAMVNHVDDMLAAHSAMDAAGLPPNSIHVIPVPHNSMWTRDYAPLFLVGPDQQTILIDAAYGEVNRPADDNVPLVLADQLSLPVLSTALKIDGGNLLSNGDGILVATTSLLQCNIDQGWTKRELYERLVDLFNAKQIVFLEPLQGEPTTHVDMFATFVNLDTIVVGSCGEEDDENRLILDQNARVLSQVETGNSLLRVVRIPMPRHDDGIWRTHTNVVFANDCLLVPTFPMVSNEHATTAIATYRKLLPTHRVIGIDSESICQSGGALHCITMNCGLVADFPVLPVPIADPPAVQTLLATPSR